ncbi:hypothetical protein N7450_000401 [Penicillium hetheringtonii]|uniref:Fungal N-terminal domain-containing protein n=1 Tax=Penicillium hetheringtonii TaxID=911720 RepID=A0AAD6E2I8_9EURO|nr:hypothetical protein N7450_000401 [Penicillium hetheringtonii]
MAEVIGVVSGAITFATIIAQVTESIITIKEYCSQCRDATDDLRYLIRDLELFELILAEMEQDISQKDLALALRGSQHVMQSLQFSREATTTLQAISDEIALKIQSSSRLRRSYAAAKIVMQRGKMERYMTRLRNAIQLLSLSQQCYTRFVMTQLLTNAKQDKRTGLPAEKLPSRYVGYMTERKENHFISETPESSNNPTEGVSQGKVPRYAQASKYLWRLSLPLWISTKALEIYSERLCHGWQWVFRTYNVIPSTSKVVSLTVAGKLEDLQNLFATKQASPFDRTDRFGYTLLHYAMLGPKKEKILKFLLELGVDSSIAGTHPNLETPLNMLVFCGTLGLGRGQPLFPCLRLLLRDTRQLSYEDAPEETINGNLSRFRGSKEEFKFLQQHCCPLYYEMPQGTRIAVASKAAFGSWDAYHMPDLIQTMLGPITLTAKDLQLEGPWRFDSKNTTLVHCVVRKIGACEAALQGSHPWKRKFRRQNQRFGQPLHIKMREGYLHLYESWVSLFIGFLQVGVDPNYVVDGQTLLLADLERAGIDLQKFGEKEDSIWKRGLVQKDLGVGYEEGPSCHRLIGFSYGSSIAEWSVWLSPKADVFLRDFWCLVELPTEMMAGGWPYE